MIHFEFKDSELTITWRMLVVIFCTVLGIYLGGVTSGYFIAQAQYAQRALVRDKTVNEIKALVVQTPDKTAEKVKQDVKDDAK